MGSTAESPEIVKEPESHGDTLAEAPDHQNANAASARPKVEGQPEYGIPGNTPNAPGAPGSPADVAAIPPGSPKEDLGGDGADAVEAIGRPAKRAKTESGEIKSL